MAGKVQRGLGYLAMVLALVAALLVPSSPAAADDPECLPMPLATWGAELPGHQTVPAGGSVCFEVAIAETGTHLVRSSQPVSSAHQLETRVSDDFGPQHASTVYWDLEDFFLDEQTTVTVEVTNTSGSPLPAAVGVFAGGDDAGCAPYTASTDWASTDGDPITFAEPGAVSCHLFTEQGVGEDYTNWLVHPGSEPVRAEVRDEFGGTACQGVASLGAITSFANDGRSVCMLTSTEAEPRKVLTYNVTRYANVPGPAEASELRIRSLADTQGCAVDLGATALPDSPLASFELGPTPQSISGADGRRCHLSDVGRGSRVYVEAPDPDTSWWLVDAAGRNQANKFQEVGGSTVRTRCTEALPCELEGLPPFRVLVEGPAGSDYPVGLRTISAPFGCVDLPGVTLGIPTQEGRLVEGGTRCYRFDGNAGDVIAPIATNPDQVGSRLPLRLEGPDGDLVGSTPQSGADRDLTLPEDGQYTLIVGPGESGSPRFELSAACRNEPCGPFVLGSLLQRTVGAGEVTLHLRGRGLAAATTEVTLRQDDVVLPTTLHENTDDRALDATVDLTGQSGSWDVIAVSARGQERVRPDDVQVNVNADPPALSTTLSTVTDPTGKAIFQPGRKFLVTVTIRNVGDTDATGAPVILHDMPPGTIVEPIFDVTTLSEDGEIVPYPYDAETFTHQGTREASTMFIVNRLGPGMTEVVDLAVTTPLETPAWTLRARSGDCLLTEGGGTAPAPRSLHRTAAESNAAADCVFAIRDVLAATLPGAGCAEMVSSLPDAWAHDLEVLSGSRAFSWGNVFDRVIATNAAAPGCAADIGLTTLKTLGKIVDAIAEGSDVVNGTGTILDGCFPDEPMPPNSPPGSPPGPSGGPSGPPGGSPLPLEPVASLDPNAVVGPAGAGADHALDGSGVHHYAVYFENDPTASAPAQEVSVSSFLDPTVYDLDTLRFTRVAFGDTTYSAGTSPTISTLIDLTDEQSIGVQVDGSVTPGGDLTVDLRSVDPATGALPTNPLVGFLPPNVDGTEGQGVITYEVELRDVPSGTTVENTADIVFDLNDPITTNTWSNLVDTDAPSAAMTAPATATGPFPVTWSGSDATSGIARMDVYVSVDGGPFAIWRDDVAPGTATYDGVPGHSYSFAAVAYDWANNRSSSDPPYGPTTVVGEPDADPAVENVARPRVIGFPIAGTGLLASKGTWNPRRVQLTFQWLRDGQPIPGAKFRIYVLRRADVGKRISVEVTASAPGRAPGSAVSKETAPIRKGLLRRPARSPR